MVIRNLTEVTGELPFLAVCTLVSGSNRSEMYSDLRSSIKKTQKEVLPLGRARECRKHCFPSCCQCSLE